jgi:hypothetical protein
MRCRDVSLALLRFCGFASNAEAAAATGDHLAIHADAVSGKHRSGRWHGGAIKTALATRAVADITSQYTGINNSTMTTILGAAATVVAPTLLRAWWSPSRR